LTLSSTDQPGGSRTAIADDNGAFSFAALPPGRYSLTASKPGYLNATYGQRTPGRQGTPIQLADGQRLKLQMQIWRGGVITGTVLDEHGDAIPNTPVRAMRYVLQSGVRTLQQNGSGQTDDRGVYRIFNLQPGEYVVSATPRNVNNQAAVAQRLATEAAAQRLTAAAAVAGAERVQIITERLQELSVAPVGPDDSATGYAPVYYPGTTSLASATSVMVGPSEEKGGVDFQYQIVSVARIDGVVTTSANAQLPQNVQVTLTTTGSAAGFNQGTRADAQGAFRLQNVPPGQYTLIARATVNQGGGRAMPPGGRGELLAGRGRVGGPLMQQDATRLWASADVTVDGRNISNIVLTLQPGVPIAGRIQFEGTSAQPPSDMTRLRVNMQPMQTPGVSGEVLTSAAGRVEADGRFTIQSVVPGRYRLSAGGAGQGWYLGSSLIDGQDSLDFPVEIKSAVNGAAVTFTDRQSELTGTITNDRSEPVADYTLIVYPSDARFRTPQSRRIQSVRPATDGRFTFRNLPPGDYRLVPVLDPEPGAWFDPSYLQQLDSGAIRVSIGEGEKKEQNLRVPSGG
jgi:protocatechuate 3,4-dioxygenase beta subunit